MGQFPRGQVSLQDLSGRIVDITGSQQGLDQYTARRFALDLDGEVRGGAAPRQCRSSWSST
ncbi:hypothetical protein [Saccharopolyspora elongata]|uniref:hypothetical protein n=1 Tax=Saccharopolyspora elongata TaxID=2530387 RepID=UPI0014045C8C|nr:hypothetical protein [Saccharopolyspora elongata]